MNYPSIEEVNESFKQGVSLNKLSEEIGVHKNTIKNHYLKLGYKYDRALHQFVKINDVTVSVTKSNTTPKPKKESIKTDANYIELERRVSRLEDLYNTLSIKVPETDFTLDSRVLRSDIKTRSIKISASAMQSFTNLAETKLSMYAKQDLLAMALLEFTDKYK